MTQTCPNCGYKSEGYMPPYMQPREKIKPTELMFMVNGVPTKLWVIPSDDAFFEITSGRYSGNLVHRFDLVKSN